MQTPVLVIEFWDERFKCSQASNVKNLHWSPITFRGDELQRKRLLRKRGGVEAYGVLINLVHIANTMPKRGVLINDTDEVLTVDDLFHLTGIDGTAIERALSMLMDAGYVGKRSRGDNGDLEPYDPTATGLFATLERHSSENVATIERRSSDPIATLEPDENEDERIGDEKRSDEKAMPGETEQANEDDIPPVLKLHVDESGDYSGDDDSLRDSEEESARGSSCSSSPGEGEHRGERRGEESFRVEKVAERSNVVPKPPPRDGEPNANRDMLSESAQRRQSLNVFQLSVMKLWAPRGARQSSSDQTETPTLFAKHIWEAGQPPPPDLAFRMGVVKDLIAKSHRNGKNKMAYFKGELRRCLPSRDDGLREAAHA